jgi:superoxide dismutase
MSSYDEVSSARSESAQRGASSAPFSLPRLPYAENALDPVISTRTIGFHYGKHHKTYIDALNKLVDGTELADQSLEAVVRATAGKADKAKIFNNAAQAWNHARFATEWAAISTVSITSGRSSPKRLWRNSAAAGPGSSTIAASSRS